MGRHSKQSRTKKIVKRSCTVSAVGGATLGALAWGTGTAGAFPGQAGLVQCESGGNPTVVNNSDSNAAIGNQSSGLFQIAKGTWKAYGGLAFAPTAGQATPAQQQIVADRIFAAQGYAPWTCKPGPGPAAFANFGGSSAPPPVSHVTPPPPPVIPHVDPSGLLYVVQPGDTLSAIASGHHTNWQAIAELNHLSNPNAIVAGLVLQLPKGATNPPPAPAPTSSAPVTTTADSTPNQHDPAPGRYHVVQDGESLWRIAAQVTGNGADWHRIYDANRDVVGSNPNLIFPGQHLAV